MRFDDRITGKLSTYAKQARKIHFDIDPSEINKNVSVDVAVLGDCKETLPAVTALLHDNAHNAWRESFSEWDKKETEVVIEPQIHPTEGPLRMGEVVRRVTELTEDKAILVTDVGQNQMMAARYFRFSESVAWLLREAWALWAMDFLQPLVPLLALRNAQCVFS